MHTMVCKAIFLPWGRQTWGQIVSGVRRHIPVIHGNFFFPLLVARIEHLL